MKKVICSIYFLISSLFFLQLFSPSALAVNVSELNNSSKTALTNLLKENAEARKLNASAIAVLVFPAITKAGFIVGGQYGEGVLWKKEKPTAYYNTAGGSFGLQAGAQQYGYALFFMKESALDALNSTQGFEIGTGPSIVVVDQGFATSMTSINTQADIYAFIFGQKGLMAGVGIQGNKITKLDQ